MSNDTAKLHQLKDLLANPSQVTAQAIRDVEELASSMEEDEYKTLAYERLVSVLVAKNDLSRAVATAEVMLYSYEKAAAFREIAAQLLKLGRIQEAVDLLEKARALPRELDINWEMAEALNQTAKALFKIAEYNQAQRLWSDAIALARLGEDSDNSQHSIDASSVLWETAETLTLAGEPVKALGVARAIKSEGKRTHALTALERIANGNEGSWKQ